MANLAGFKFDNGFKKMEQISLFGLDYNIVVKLVAYYEKDGITDDQVDSYEEFQEGIQKILEGVEELLAKAHKLAQEVYVPTMLLVNRDGSYGLLFDDEEDPEGGIVVTVKPTQKIELQDEYL